MMNIKTKNKTYSIYQTLAAYQEMRVFLARDTNNNKELFLINEISSPQLIRAHLKIFLNFSKNSNIREYFDVFIHHSKLFLVFKYNKPMLIMNYLNKYKPSFSEKVAIIDNYLFQLASYHRFPPALIHSLTDTDNINIDLNRTVYFNFSLKPQHLAESVGKRTLLLRIASLLQTVFSEELSGIRKNKQLQIIMDKCNKGIYKSILEIKKDVQDIDTATFFEKVGAYIQARKSTLILARNLGISAFMLVFLYILYTSFISPGPPRLPEPALQVTRIGDVSLKEKLPEENIIPESDEPVVQVIKIEID